MDEELKQMEKVQDVTEAVNGTAQVVSLKEQEGEDVRKPLNKKSVVEKVYKIGKHCVDRFTKLPTYLSLLISIGLFVVTATISIFLTKLDFARYILYVVMGIFVALNVVKYIKNKKANTAISIISLVLSVVLFGVCIFMEIPISKVAGIGYYKYLVQTDSKNIDNVCVSMEFGKDKVEMSYDVYEYNSFLGLKSRDDSQSGSLTYDYELDGNTLIINANRYYLSFDKDGNMVVDSSLRPFGDTDFLSITVDYYGNGLMFERSWRSKPLTRWSLVNEAIFGK